MFATRSRHSSVLGLDPGVAMTGYGLVAQDGPHLGLVESGVVKTPPEQALEARLRTIFEEVSALLDRLSPGAVAVERVLFSANARTAMAVGQGSGVALLAASQAGIPVEQFSPNEVKLAVAGYGGAPKVQVARMVATLLSLRAPPRPDDAADACALAICHLQSQAMRARAREERGSPSPTMEVRDGWGAEPR
jgi:crossover junction endodeoxyribonuclease RuvC